MPPDDVCESLPPQLTYVNYNILQLTLNYTEWSLNLALQNNFTGLFRIVWMGNCEF